jgi:hypothetical protein
MAASNKNCQQCKKSLDISHFTDEKGKVLGKCNPCRVKLIKKTNKCSVCGIKAIYNILGQTKGVRCKEHRDLNMINITDKRICVKKDCKKRPSYNIEGETKALYCSEHKLINMIDVKSKTCIEKGCKKIPCYNIEGEIRALYCNEHKLINMIDVKNKTCTEKGCKKIPCYNIEGEIRAFYCNEHKKDGMINIKDKTCIENGCKKIPNYNIEGETKALYCNEHKKDGMIDIKHKTCIEKGCKKRPSYNIEGETKALYCYDHKLINMINIKDKTCTEKGCKKRPSYNIEGETKALYCNKHKKEDMIDIKTKTCIEKGCKIQSNYGLPGTSKTHCLKHMGDGMIKNPTKRCSTKDCKEYATHGFKDPLFCENHAEKDHYNLCERKCTNQSCPYPERLDILNREGLCVTFCSLIKRDQMMKTHIKKKEEFIGNLLKTEIKQELSHRDQIIDSSCSKVRPDFVFDCGTHFVIIEVDEHQHKSYSNCGTTLEERQKMENKRMFMIFQSFGGPRVAFIRYNPDVFRANDKVVTMGDQKRHKCLLQWVKHYLKNQPENPLEVKYLFYDGYDESDQTMISICEQDVM